MKHSNWPPTDLLEGPYWKSPVHFVLCFPANGVNEVMSVLGCFGR